MTLQLAIPFTLVGAFLQATVLAPYWPLDGKPDLVPVIVLLWAAYDRAEEGLVWAFLGGFFLDIFSGLPMGSSSALLVVIALIMGILETQVYRANIAFLLITMGISLLAYHIGQMILATVLTGSILPWRYALLNITLPALLFDLILVIPLTLWLSRLYERTHPRGVKI